MANKFYSPRSENHTKVISTRRFFQIIYRKEFKILKGGRPSFLSINLLFEREANMIKKLNKMVENELVIIDIYEWNIPEAISLRNFDTSINIGPVKSAYSRRVTESYKTKKD